jgi:hypothetical protein
VNRAAALSHERRENVSTIHANDRAFVHMDDDVALTTRTAINAGRMNIAIDLSCAAATALERSIRSVNDGFYQLVIRLFNEIKFESLFHDHTVQKQPTKREHDVDEKSRV